MKIATIFLQWDYGIEKRGLSGEYYNFYLPLTKLLEVVPFWIEGQENLQEKIKEFIDTEKPDIVFTCLMRDEISFDTLDYIKSKCKIYNWFCDDHWRLGWSLEVSKHLTGALTVDKYSIDYYKARGIPVILTQWASNYYAPESEHEYKYDVCFIGLATPKRREYLQYIANLGIKMSYFGQGWDNGRATQEQIRELMVISKICLNLSNSEGNKTCEQIKARNFEIPSMGGFQLSHYALGLEDYFEIGKEIVVFANKEDLLKQVIYYMHHEAEREQIKKAGWIRAKEYTYLNRWKDILCHML